MQYQYKDKQTGSAYATHQEHLLEEGIRFLYNIDVSLRRIATALEKEEVMEIDTTEPRHHNWDCGA